MANPFGPNGPYLRRRWQRDRFPSLIEKVGGEGDSLVSSLGSYAIADMGSWYSRDRTRSREAQRRAAQAAKEANVQPARLYLRSTSRGMRPSIDIYMPRLTQDADPASSDSENQPEVYQPPPAPRQAKAPSDRGTSPQCRRLGNDDVDNNKRVNEMVQRIIDEADLNLRHLQRKQTYSEDGLSPAQLPI